MNDLDREKTIQRFLTMNGIAPDTARPLAQDASFRRYFRLERGAVLMDTSPDEAKPFLAMAAHLEALGLSVPRIIAAAADLGLIIEEDLGDDLFSSVLIESNAEVLFDHAIDALVVMHRAAAAPGVPTWGKTAMIETSLATLLDWWWPAMHGTPAPEGARIEVRGALDRMLEAVDSGPRCLVHRDYFAGNLLWLPDRTGPRRAGIIDFQSASIGHPAYDLVSLLQDARRDIPVALEQRSIARYLATRPEIDPVAFLTAYTACAAQRHLRVACQWVRLAVRDGRPEYLAHGPRTWGLLNRALADQAAAPLAAALARWVPPDRRRNPPGLSA